MPEAQFTTLLARLQEDAGLQENLKHAPDLDAFIAAIRDAGFNISKDDWLKLLENQTLELGDEELESVSGGFIIDAGVSIWKQCARWATIVRAKC